MNRLALIAVSVAGLGAAAIDAAAARTLAPAGGSNAPPFTATLSNAGDETLLAFRNVGGSGLFFHKDRLYLQFRKGRLTGWKGDWGHNWMWQ